MKYSDTKTLRLLASKDQGSRIPDYSLDPDGFHILDQVGMVDDRGMIRVLVLAKMKGEIAAWKYMLDVQAADYLALPDWESPTEEESKT